MDQFISDNKLNATFAYVDNVTICGMTIEEHNTNLEKFMNAASRMNFTFNENKSVVCATEINILGYEISHRSLKPDSERMKPLRDLPIPTNVRVLTPRLPT